MEANEPRRARGLHSGDTIMRYTAKKKNARLWRVELEGGGRFTVEADDRGEAIQKAIKWSGRTTRVAKVDNVALLMATGKL